MFLTGSVCFRRRLSQLNALYACCSGQMHSLQYKTVSGVSRLINYLPMTDTEVLGTLTKFWAHVSWFWKRHQPLAVTRIQLQMNSASSRDQREHTIEKHNGHSSLPFGREKKILFPRPIVDVWKLHTKTSLKQYVSVMVQTAPSNPQTTYTGTDRCL
jgi:hypothetical protein